MPGGVRVSDEKNRIVGGVRVLNGIKTVTPKALLEIRKGFPRMVFNDYKYFNSSKY